MQKQHVQHAADLVKSILEGHWVPEAPSWVPYRHLYRDYHRSLDQELVFDGGGLTDGAAHYTRAVWTAETFIQLFSAYNPLFDQQRFLIACGLVDAPVKPKRGIGIVLTRDELL